MKIKKTGKDKKKKILLIDKAKEVQNYTRKRKEEDILKFKSSDFKVVSLSGVSYTEIVQKQKEAEKKRKNKLIKDIIKLIAVFIILALFILFILIRFKFIEINFKELDSKINTSFLYNDSEEDILKLLFEYKNSSYTEYIESNISFTVAENEKNNIKNKELQELDNENLKNTSYENIKEIVDKYKEIIENTKLEYKRKDINQNDFKSEINFWVYNQPVFTNMFLVKGDKLTYDSLILKKKLDTDVNSFRKYFKKYYVYDYIIDKLKMTDDILNFEDNNLIYKYLENENDSDFKDNLGKDTNPVNNLITKISYSDFNYERELGAFSKIVLNPKIKEKIFSNLNFTRDEEQIVINLDTSNGKRESLEKDILEIYTNIKNDETLKKDITDFLYIYLNRKPKYLFKEYGKNEIREAVNTFFEKEDADVAKSVKENIQFAESFKIIYHINTYNSLDKTKNKILKIEIELNFKDYNFTIIKSNSYQEGKDIKTSSKESLKLNDEEKIRENEKNLINETERDLNKSLKIYSKIKQIKEEYITKDKSPAVLDAKNKRSKKDITPAIKRINELMLTRVKKGVDLSKINVQEEIKKLLLEEFNLKFKNGDISNINFKLDIDENTNNVIFMNFTLKMKDNIKDENNKSKTYEVRAEFTKDNILDINTYKFR